MNFGLSEDLISQIKNIFLKYNEIDKAVIFGSRARGDFKYNSDIDIAIFTNSDKSIRGSLLGDFDEINTLYKFDVVQINKVSDENLVNNIFEQGIEIYRKS